ncbi:hypothetical protein [Xanthomonas citri]|uniref:hypothetical protein n=1 Tax=Xanthomonas citri TaxID=346 RepID=UPI001C047BAC|nr:hypothetical protein [Xanthomonas citri]MCC8567288.1 hypothetical protein [Xanthomonas citri pv. fuscans]
MDAAIEPHGRVHGVSGKWRGHRALGARGFRPKISAASRQRQHTTATDTAFNGMAGSSYLQSRAITVRLISLPDRSTPPL